MRGSLHFQMSDGQRHRLSLAYQMLREAPGSYHASAIVNVGDTIPVDRESTVLKGHGTQQVDGQLMSSVCGIVERVDRLVTVRPLRTRYNAETGDVVVGRITELGPKRWKVDVNFKQDVQLMLSSVNLPGGIQRRRTAVDELNMRSLFVENDLISAEVQSVHPDGSVHLHTRSLKYGKLEKGQLIVVSPYLVKRLKQHFHHLKEYGIDMIIGCNGYIWISASSDTQKVEQCSSPAISPGIHAIENESFSRKGLNAGIWDEQSELEEEKRDFIPLEVREKICRFANAVRVLSTLGFLIHPDSIVDTYEASLSSGIDVKGMLGAEFCVRTAEREADHRPRKRGYH
eukprot:c22508_g1_i1 orf=190-1218(+)